MEWTRERERETSTQVKGYQKETPYFCMVSYKEQL